MGKLLLHFKKLDWVLISTALFLVIFGLVSIYSSSLGRGDFFNFQKQIIFFIASIFLMFLLSFTDWRFFREDPYLILIFYFICLAGLLGLFFFAPIIRGIRSWYRLGPFYVDPVEFTKIILLFILAKYFSMRHVEMYRVRHILLSGLYILLPSLLIFFQPDLGPVIILILFWLGMLVISGIKLRHFFILFLCLILISALCWSFLLKDYQRQRILSFLYPIDPLGLSWSQDQAKIAIGSAGIFGQGISRGSQTQHGFLTEPQTDFIFSAIAEETGFLGVSFLFFLFSILIWRIIRIAALSRSNFPRLFASGFAIFLIFQTFIHIGMNLGLLPIVGLSLPFVSYGGSNLLINFVALGIIQSIKVN